MKSGTVVALSVSAQHTMQKFNTTKIQLLKGLGVKGDAHMGAKVKHRSRVAKDPTRPNLRQVHLIHQELHLELKEKGFDVSPGLMGENITTQGIDLLSLPRNTVLKIGPSVAVRVTGLRNPCYQLDGLQEGLMKAVLDRDEKGALIRKAGIMGVVEASGAIKLNDTIEIQLPPTPHFPLEPV